MITFPAAPADGQVFTAPSGVRYTYVAASKLWRNAQAALVGNVGLPILVLTGPTVAVDPVKHLGRTLGNYGSNDISLQFAGTLPNGWECNIYQDIGATGRVLPSVAAPAVIDPFYSGHIGTAGPGAYANLKVTANPDGVSAQISLVGMTAA